MSNIAQLLAPPMHVPDSTTALLQKLGAPPGMKFMGADQRHGDDRDRVEQEAEFSKKVFEWLYHDFPGHMWEVTCDSRHRGVQIRIGVLMTGSHCQFIRFDDVATENDFKKRVREAGGNLLERFRIPRSAIDFARFVEARPKAVFHHNQKVPE